MSQYVDIYVSFMDYIFFFFFVFLGPHPRHMEIPRLGVTLELQLPAYTTATSTPDLRHVCDLHHSSRQRWILNPLSKARIEPASSWIPVTFVSAKSRWELLDFIFLNKIISPTNVFLPGSYGV